MHIIRTKMDQISASHLYDMICIERGPMTRGITVSDMQRKYFNHEMFLFLENDELIGFAAIRSGSLYLPKSSFIDQFCFTWRHNNTKHIQELFALLQEAIRGNGTKNLLMDVDKEHEINLELYWQLGFVETFFKSPKGKKNIIILLRF